MKTFKEIRIGCNFILIGCLGRSRWIKTSDKMATCVDTENGRYELNQDKPFIPNQIVETI